MAEVDVIVLGAGIVGVTTALNLRQHGASVALIDRAHPGDGTSGANAGIIAGNGFCPAQIPSGAAVWLDIALKQSCAFSFDVSTLLHLVPWIRSYLAHSGPQALQSYVRAMAPLRAQARAEHRRLARLANAERFYRKSGWLHLHRSEASLARAERERHYARIYGIDYQTLRGGEMHEVEPALRSDAFFGVYWPECDSISNPGGLTESLWREFIQGGGIYLNGDAGRLEQRRSRWILATPRTELRAPQVVVALGQATAAFAARFEEPFPVALGRGYGRHFRPGSGVTLSRPVTDMDHGFTLTPMEQGIRLTTGIEIVGEDAPANPQILHRARKRASDVFPLGQDLPLAGLMGSRDCLPDSLPVVGPSSKHRGLWYNFGYCGAGMALGPVCSRLIADRLAGAPPKRDADALLPLRFS
ncbi:NAD(P)/FAD-dependent oxidoreductase [Roseibium sp.]|uniref:NAD(P)/FAD-dependent oxidoreductase n=1 Tax=Roseibium sp. TaxID=1936156 RepID=UPI003A984F82